MNEMCSKNNKYNIVCNSRQLKKKEEKLKKCSCIQTDVLNLAPPRNTLRIVIFYFRIRKLYKRKEIQNINLIHKKQN